MSIRPTFPPPAGAPYPDPIRFAAAVTQAELLARVGTRV
jgi:hypothetical protein